jgi:beta-lactamase class A
MTDFQGDMMSIPVSRRAVLGGSLLAVPAILYSRRKAQAAAGLQGQLAELERKNGGRLGVSVLNVATGNRIGHRADERFAMCSTFKFLAASFVLARVDRGEEKLDRRIVFSEKDLLSYAPTTGKHVGEPGMTVGELCEAAVTLSDNTAANLLLASFGGPAGLTAYARSIGDEVTRLDRTEPTLNEAKHGDPRDTTTPAAMLEDMRKHVLGDLLSPSSRDQLIAWLLANKTGDKRLRAGLPKDWRVGDKTGTGENGTSNDIAVVWPPDGGPLVIACYYTESSASDDRRSAVIAEVARIARQL